MAEDLDDAALRAEARKVTGEHCDWAGDKPCKSLKGKCGPCMLLDGIVKLARRVRSRAHEAATQRFAALERKYSRDGGSSQARTLGEIVADLIAARGNREKFLDVLDAEFLAGCWKHVIEDLKGADRLYFPKDIRGLVLAVADAAHEAGRRKGLEEVAKRVVAACKACDGAGGIPVTVGHEPSGPGDPGCHEEEERCEYCGRPVDVIRALAADSGGSE